jgi:hypothetical protein
VLSSSEVVQQSKFVVIGQCFVDHEIDSDLVIW